MAQVVVTIAGRTYRMNCEDGQEPHLQRLARDVDGRMGEMRKSFGEIGDQRLVVMTALTIADELDAAKRKVETLEVEISGARARIDEAAVGANARAAELEAVMDSATTRVNHLLEVLSAQKL